MKDFWKNLAFAFAGILVAGVAHWLILGRNVITRAEAEQIISQSVGTGPKYSEDKKYLDEKLNNLSSQIQKVEDKQNSQDQRLGQIERKIDIVILQNAKKTQANLN